MDKHSKKFILYMIAIFVGVTSFGGLSAYFFCDVSNSIFCIEPTFEIILSAIIGVATTALFFWLIEKRQKEIEASQNANFLTQVYPRYRAVFRVGWGLSMMYYASHPQEILDEINHTCKIFEISTETDLVMDKEFLFFLKYGCRPQYLVDESREFKPSEDIVDETEKSSEDIVDETEKSNEDIVDETEKSGKDTVEEYIESLYNEIKDMSNEEKFEYFRQLQLRIKRKLEYLRDFLAKESSIKYGVSVGEIIHVGWAVNKFVAKGQAYDVIIEKDLIKKVENALKEFYSPQKVIEFCRKTFELIINDKMSLKQVGNFGELLYNYISHSGTRLEEYEELTKFLSSKSIPTEEKNSGKVVEKLAKFLSSKICPYKYDFVERSDDIIKKFRSVNDLFETRVYEKEITDTMVSDDWVYEIKQEKDFIIFEAKVPGIKDDIIVNFDSNSERLHLYSSSGWSQWVFIEGTKNMEIFEHTFENNVLTVRIKKN